MMKLATVSFACLLATAAAVSYPSDAPRCFRPERNTVYDDEVELGESFTASFTYFPNADSDGAWSEIFRNTADTDLSDVGVDGRNLALFTHPSSPEIIYMATGNPSSVNQNCPTSALTAPIQKIRCGVSYNRAFIYVNDVLECEFELASENVATTGVLMGSNYYSAAPGQVCGLEITSSPEY